MSPKYAATQLSSMAPFAPSPPASKDIFEDSLAPYGAIALERGGYGKAVLDSGLHAAQPCLSERLLPNDRPLDARREVYLKS
ncbi:MAG: hypothetical protein ACXV7G_12735 [Halobacteriota archaeon]